LFLKVLPGMHFGRNEKSDVSQD